MAGTRPQFTAMNSATRIMFMVRHCAAFSTSTGSIVAEYGMLWNAMMVGAKYAIVHTRTPRWMISSASIHDQTILSFQEYTRARMNVSSWSEWKTIQNILKSRRNSPWNMASDAGGAAVHLGTISTVSKICAPFIRRYNAVVVTSQNSARFRYRAALMSGRREEHPMRWVHGEHLVFLPNDYALTIRS